MTDDDKRLAAEAAVAEVQDGMLVGLGTGSTAAFAIAALGRRVQEGLNITAVATSLATEAAARAVGIPVIDFAQIATLDLTIDGADEIDAALLAIKGAGGAMLREKVVATASRRMVVVADGSKRVARIGAAKLPVEVLPFARAFAESALRTLFDEVTIRRNGEHDYTTDNGNIIFDCRDWQLEDPGIAAAALSSFPGVVGHGLFLTEVNAAYIAHDGLVTRVERVGASG